MKEIIAIYSGLFILLLNMAGSITTTATAQIAERAKSYKTEVVAEIENSNFNPAVIEACRVEAESLGYDLSVEACAYDEERDIQMAEVVLTYSYKMPLFGVDETCSTYGIAR